MMVAAEQAGLADDYARLKRLSWGRVFAKLSMFWLLCYPGVSVKLMRVFKCVYVQGEWWLEADMRLQCFDSGWYVAAVISAVMLCVYTAGLPIGIAVWLYRKRHTLSTEQTKVELGFLYEVYGTGKGQYLWEVMELLRKLVLTSLVLFFSAGSALQLCFALIVSGY